MRIILAVVIAVFSLVGFTPQSWAQQDASGSRDHALLSRYPGFYIREYKTSEFDQAEIITGPAFKNEDGDYELKLDSAEGEVTNILYRRKGADISVYALLTNYKTALEKLNADIIFTCEGSDECGASRIITQGLMNDRSDLFKGFRPAIGKDFAIISGVVSEAESTAHVLVVIGADRLNERLYINQSIISSAKLEADKLDIGNLTASLKTTGTVVLEGVQFGLDTADLQPDSTAVLDVLQDYLEGQPDVSAFIVGHTDNTGAYDYNVNLSKARAEAVVKDLVARGIKPSRLTGIGIGPVSPIASNDVPAGQALNRRVEMVIK